MLTNTT